MKLPIVKKHKKNTYKNLLYIGISVFVLSLLFIPLQPFNKEPPYWDVAITQILSLFILLYNHARTWVYKNHIYIGNISLDENFIAICVQNKTNIIMISEIDQITFKYLNNAQDQSRGMLINIEGIDNLISIKTKDEIFEFRVKVPNIKTKLMIENLFKLWRKKGVVSKFYFDEMQPFFVNNTFNEY